MRVLTNHHLLLKVFERVSSLNRQCYLDFAEGDTNVTEQRTPTDGDSFSVLSGQIENYLVHLALLIFFNTQFLIFRK